MSLLQGLNKKVNVQQIFRNKPQPSPKEEIVDQENDVNDLFDREDVKKEIKKTTKKKKTIKPPPPPIEEDEEDEEAIDEDEEAVDEEKVKKIIEQEAQQNQGDPPKKFSLLSGVNPLYIAGGLSIFLLIARIIQAMRNKDKVDSTQEQPLVIDDMPFQIQGQSPF